MMLGWLSPRALAAGALGFNLYQPAFLLGIGLVAALSPIAAAQARRGRRRREPAARKPAGLSLRSRHRRRHMDRARCRPRRS